MGIRADCCTTVVMEHEYNSNQFGHPDSKNSSLLATERITSSDIAKIGAALFRKDSRINENRSMPPVPDSSPLRIQVNGFNKDHLMNSCHTNSSQDADSNQSNISTVSSFLSMDSPSVSGFTNSPLPPLINDSLGFPSESILREAVRLANPSSHSLRSPDIPPSSSKKRDVAPKLDTPSSNMGPPKAVQQREPRPPPGPNSEVVKRKTLSEKVTKLKEKGTLHFFVPQVESLTPIQLGLHLRRYHKREGTSFSPDIRRRVFEEEDSTTSSKVQRSQPSTSRGFYDPDATDISDVEEPDDSMSAPSYKYLSVDRIALRGLDSKAITLIEDNKTDKERLEKKALVFEPFSFASPSDDEETCVRCRPLMNPSLRRELGKQKKASERSRVDYDSMEPSTSAVASSPPIEPRSCSYLNPNGTGIPITRRMEAYLHEASCMPSSVLRKRVDVSPWLNDVDDELIRSGKNKKDSCPRKTRGRGRPPNVPLAEVSLSETSSDDEFAYGDGDSDEEYLPVDDKERRSNGKRDKRKKIRRKRPLYEDEDAADPPAHLTKLGRRHTVPTSKRVFDIDDVVFGADSGISGLPDKIVYKEIAIPGFRKIDPSFWLRTSASSTDDSADVAHRNHIRQLHLVMLEKERRMVSSRPSHRVGGSASYAQSVNESDSRPMSPSQEPEPGERTQLFTDSMLPPSSVFQAASYDDARSPVT